MSEQEIEYFLVFDDQNGRGYAFPCKSNGALLQEAISYESFKQYIWCMGNPHMFIRYNKIVPRDSLYLYNPPEVRTFEIPNLGIIQALDANGLYNLNVLSSRSKKPFQYLGCHFDQNKLFCMVFYNQQEERYYCVYMGGREGDYGDAYNHIC